MRGEPKDADLEQVILGKSVEWIAAASGADAHSAATTKSSGGSDTIRSG